MRKLPLYFLLFLITASTLTGCRYVGNNGESLGSESKKEEKAGEAREAKEPRKPNPIADLSMYTDDEYAMVFNDSNYIQYESAERMGIDPIQNLTDAYQTRRPLVKIGTCDNYVVDNLTHSVPFLVPEAANLLDEIGKEFGDKVEAKVGNRATRMVVTSVLRTPYTVKKLRQVNRNAVDSSTHMFATTFDIAYNGFASGDSARFIPPATLKRFLAEVLHKKRREEKCYVKYERNSPCFHITVNK